MKLWRTVLIAALVSIVIGAKAALPSIDGVLHQTGAGFPTYWGSNAGKPVPAYYEMARAVVDDLSTRGDLAKGLRGLPSLTLTLAGDDLFSAEKGIYSNPLKTGAEWERTCELAYVPVDGTTGFNVRCGVRIQGGWNRRPEESPKHAFRLFFRKKYGAGKLKHSLFDGAEPRVFDELILRAGCNNSWLHWSAEERRRGDYIRDQWMRDSYRAMGHPSARGEFVHVYLNGLYWGIYNLTERPDAAFAAAHFGGHADDYDARNGENVLSGDTEVWDRMFRLANGGITTAPQYAAIGELLDLPAFADYMLLNLYGGNADWDRASNWYAARKRPNGKFVFFVWDGERTLEDSKADTTNYDDDLSPPRLFQKLRTNEEFRALLRERAKLHLTGEGALSPSVAAGRYRIWSDKLHAPIVAESARWGAYRHDVHQYKTGPYEVYTRDRHWTPEIERLLTDYFPKRSAIVLEQINALK